MNILKVWLNVRGINFQHLSLECIGANVDTATQYQTDYVHILTESKEKRLRYVSVKLVWPNVVGAK